MVQEIKPSVPPKPKNKALHFVLGMGAAVLGVCLICGLIWWITGDRDYDISGTIYQYCRDHSYRFWIGNIIQSASYDGISLWSDAKE